MLPDGSYTAQLTGTGSGTARLGIRALTTAGTQNVSVFALTARKGATGSLTLTRNGAASALRFAGKRITGHNGIRLAPLGLPARIDPGKPARIRVRTVDELGAVVPATTIRLTGPALKLTMTSGRHGYATLAFNAPKSNTKLTLELTGTAPHVIYRTTIKVAPKPK